MSFAKIYQLAVGFLLHSLSFSLHIRYEIVGVSTHPREDLLSLIIGAGIYDTA